jgi:hypothetical protein
LSTALFAFKYTVQKILNPTDENTLNLLSDYTITNGRNYDVLIKIENDTITAKTLEQLIRDSNCKIGSRILYTPNIFPWVNHDNLKQTVFKGWEAPSFYSRFREENNTIICESLEQNTITLNDYIEKAKCKIESNIKNILNNNSEFVLFYSRGVDSLLILSYLIKYNRLKDTQIVTCPNTNLRAYKESNFELERQLGFNIEIHELGYDSLLEYANQSNPFKFHNYQTYWYLEKFKNKTLLCGNEGNSVLFHKWEWVKRLGKPITKENVYVNTCLNIDWNTPTDLNHHTITFIEPYSRSWSNQDFNRIVSPISDIELTKMLPYVDIRNMDPNFVGDAVLIRDMIRANVGSEFDHLIEQEKAEWGMIAACRNIKIKDINEDQLIIDFKRRIEPITLVELRRRIDGAKKEGEIDTQRLLSLKYINYFL